MGLGTWLIRAAYGVGGVAVLGVGLLYMFQEKLLYVPRVPGIDQQYYEITPDRYRLAYEDVWLESEDGTKLHAWMLWQPEWTSEELSTKRVIMFFQENAGPMTFRLPFLRELIRRTGCAVFALDYRGYGRSAGSPSEAGIQADARAAMQHVLSRTDVDVRRVLLFGRSLGGAVALHVAGCTPGGRVGGVVLENAFSSVEAMVPQVLPPLGALIGPGRPLNWLVRNKWDNLRAIASPVLAAVPLLLLVSLRDEMVPPAQMAALHGAAERAHGGRRLTLVEFPRARHMDAYDAEPVPYWSAMTTFMQTTLDTPGS